MGRVVRYYGDDVGVNIFITTTLVALVRQVRREISSSPPPLSRLSSLFLELSRLGGRRDREANLRLLWTASSLSYLFPFFCFFPFFFFFYLEFFYAKARSSVVRRIRVFSRSNLRIHEMHETVVRKLAFLIVQSERLSNSIILLSVSLIFHRIDTIEPSYVSKADPIGNSSP